MSRLQQTGPEPSPSSGVSEFSFLQARVVKISIWVVALLAVLSIVSFLLAVRLRLPFPYDIHDVGLLLELQHLHDGLPLYAPPSVEFTPYLYTPIYFYAASAMAHFTGVNYSALRLVSALATVGCFGMIYALVYSETRRHFAAVVAAGLFAACYPVVMQWFDVGRVDMLYLLFVLLALYATRWWHPAFAAVLWVLAFQTKQGVLPVAVLALAHDWQRPKRTLSGLLAFAVLLWGSIAWMNHATGGWYSYYLFHLVSGFGYNMHVASRFLTDDLLGVDGIALLIVLAAFLLRPLPWTSRKVSFYALNCIGLIVFSGYVRAHRGAAINAVLPAYVWIAVLAGLALARLLEWLESRKQESWQPAAMLIVMAAVAVQFGVHIYSPREFSPKAEDIAQREKLVAQLRQLPGDVLVATHPEIAEFAGKARYSQIDATGSVIDAKDEVVGDRLIREYAELIHGRHFSAVVLDRDAGLILESKRSWMPRDFDRYYPLRIVIAEDANPQWGLQPKLIYLPCTQLEAAKVLQPGLDASVCIRPAPLP